MGFEEFGGEVGGETADKEEKRVADDNEKSDNEEFVGGEKSKIEEIAEERNEESEGDNTENNDEK